MFVGSNMDDDDVIDDDVIDGSVLQNSVFFFLLLPSELVPVWILGEGVDLGDTTIVWVAADDLRLMNIEN